MTKHYTVILAIVILFVNLSKLFCLTTDSYLSTPTNKEISTAFQSVTFSNTGCLPIKGYWNNSGEEIYYFTITPGNSYTQTTGPGHQWIFKNLYPTNTETYISTISIDNSSISYDIKSRDNVIIHNNSSKTVTVWCEELNTSGALINMGQMSAGQQSFSIYPDADYARIYAADNAGNTISEFYTTLNDSYPNCSHTFIIKDNATSGANCNIISNPEFFNNTNDWFLYQSAGSAATLNIDNSSQLSGTNAAFIDIQNGSTEDWHIELANIGHSLEVGKTYEVSFEAKAAAARTIGVALQIREDPWVSYWSETLSLTTTAQTFSYTNITTTTTVFNKIGFMVRGGNSNTDFWIDNVIVKEQNCNESTTSVELCSGGQDEDGDGLTDCDDPDCFTVSAASANVPKSISSNSIQTIQSTLTIDANRTITDVNVKNLNITHSYIGDLKVTLTSPQGTSVQLFNQQCGGNSNMLLQYDDEASYSTITCPPIGGQAYQPLNSLSQFDGENMQGTWTLTIEDTYGEDGGSLNSWELSFSTDCATTTEICDNNIDDDGDGAIDSADPDCSGCSSPSLIFQNPILVSGSPGAVGASYKFSNIIAGTDARIKIVNKSHSDIQILNMDLPAAGTGGYDYAFQPEIDYNWLNSNGSQDAYGEKWVQFEISFYEAGTNNLQVVPKTTMSAVDVDGNGGAIREFVESSNFSSYQLQSNTNLTTSGALRARGSYANEAGITETALHTMISYDFTNVSSILVKYGAEFNIGTANESEQRLNCLFFKCYEFDVTQNCPAISISGDSKVCTNKSIVLTSTTSNTIGSCSLHWQSSTNGQSWNTITGTNNNTYTTPNLSQDTYYRVGITCSSTSYCGTIYSTPYLVSTVTCVEICGSGQDEDQDGKIDCEDSDCETISITPFVQDNNGSWSGNTTTITANAGENLCLSWQPSPTPTGASVRWLNSNNELVSTAHDYCLTNLVAAQAGNYQLEVTSQTGCISTASFTITIIGTNCIPNANNDTYVITGNTLSEDLAENETNTTSVQYSPVTAPSHGTVSLQSDGTFTYTTTNSYCGEDQFTYQVCAGDDCCKQATAVISISDNCTIDNACPTGTITYERWLNIEGNPITNLTTNSNYPNSPSEAGVLSLFQGPSNYGENYGTRVRGYLHPTVTGNYTFTITADDEAALYLSTNTQSSSKNLIANIVGWAYATEFDKYPSQTSSAINLTAGQRYYIEFLHKEGGGGDHFQVYWQTPSNSTRTIIPGSNLSPISCGQEICGNDIDDDNDGLVDEDDPDCCAFIPTTNTLELAAGAGNTTANGPTTTSQILTFQTNTNNPTGNTFNSYTNPLKATFSLSSQQYNVVNNNGQNIGKGISFGAANNSVTKTPVSSEIFQILGGISGPSNNQFTSQEAGIIGTGIDIDSNKGIRLYTSMEPLYEAAVSTSGRYYFGNLTISFNKAVKNPILHIAGLGARLSSNNIELGMATELELQTAGISLSKLSGNNNLFIEAGKNILNSATDPNAFSNDGAATGSILVSGSTITTLTFKVYVRGDGDLPSWSNNNRYIGDAFIIGLSKTDKADCPEICGNGIDDDQDGQIDCADGDCGVPIISNVTKSIPNNCPDLTNGQIRVIASGSALQYSINGGATYQTSDLFTGLSAGTYTITIKNSTSGCSDDYINNPIIFETAPCEEPIPPGTENCANGIDDDEDGLVDAYDPDCSCITAGIPNISFKQAPDGTLLPAGTIVSEIWSDWGVHITTQNPTDHPPMIFDSSNPTGGDNDLGTPNQDFGGPGIGGGGETGTIGENNKALGNLVIISHDGDSSNPNDLWGGGSLIYTFDEAVNIHAIEMIDCDTGQPGEIKAYNANNTIIGQAIVNDYGNNSYQKITLNAVNVSKLEVIVPTSFSMGSILFCDDTPEEETPPVPNCNTVNLSSLNGSTNAVTDFNNANVTIGDATITLSTTFAGTATADEDEINDSHETGSYGVKLGVFSAGPPNYLEATYSFSEPITNFNGRILDIDRSDALNIYGTLNGTPVAFTVANQGSCVNYDGNNTINSTCLTTNGNAATAATYAIEVTFTSAIDQLVFQSYDPGPGVGGAYTFVISPEASCSEPPTCDVNLSLPNTSSCISDSTLPLSGGTPEEGTFSGSGVTGTNFDASIAGIGTHIITYTYTDVNNCTASATEEVTVSSCDEICNNGIDDDGDGKIDCADGDCANESIIITPTITDDCSNDNTGSVTLAVSGGTAPYSYIWTDMPVPDAQWDFENTTNDISGNMHHEDIVGRRGVPIYSADSKEGLYALSLDGSTFLQYSLDDGFMKTAMSSWALSFWMKPASLTGSQVIFEEGGFTNGVSIRLNDNTLEFGAADNYEQIIAGAHSFPNDGAWHAVLAVYQNDSLSLYLDGIKGTTVPAVYNGSEISNHINSGGIGRAQNGSIFAGGSGSYYTGLLDDFKYYVNQNIPVTQLADLARNDGSRSNLSSGIYSVTIKEAIGKCNDLNSISVSNICEEICGDGIDNDGDDLIDCDDTDSNCNTTPTITETINGVTSPCVNSTVTYSIVATDNASTYTWTVPTGWTITSGQGTTTITVTVGSNNGEICVTPANNCATGNPLCMTVTPLIIPGTPTELTGSSTICANSLETYSITTTASMATYTWTVPEGWTIETGQGTTTITVMSTATSGNICVTATNDCGTNDEYCAPILINPNSINNACPIEVPIVPNSTSISSTGVTASSRNCGTTTNWVNTDNIATANNAYTSITLGKNDISNCLDIKDLGFNLPNGAVVEGIAVTIEGYYSGSYTIQDNAIRLISANGSAIGDNKANNPSSGTVWNTSENTWTYGGNIDLWGTDLDRTDINDPDFGVSIQLVNGQGSGNNTSTASIDQVTILVYYTPPATICNTDTLKITPLATVDDYIWTISNGGTLRTGQGSTAVTFNYPTAGLYQICVAPNNECSTFNNCCRWIQVDICAEICDDGIDNDNQGGTDCEDSACGKPIIDSVDPVNPEACPNLDDGRITINASGINLAYRIDTTQAFITENIFLGLEPGIYIIEVQNSVTGCIARYADEIELEDQECEEECEGSLDQDGDGLYGYQDDDCSGGGGWPAVYTPTSTWSCGGIADTFRVERALPGFKYHWSFGPYASVEEADSIGPHIITFLLPENSKEVFPEVIFVAAYEGNEIYPPYEVRDTYNLQVRQELSIVSTVLQDPSTCVSDDGQIKFTISKPAESCVQISLNGSDWEEEDKVDFNNLSTGTYDVRIRYCDAVCEFPYHTTITLSNPIAATVLKNNVFTSICPGQTYRNTVTSNDDLQGTGLVYSPATIPMFGTLTLETNGSFEYKSDDNAPLIDEFTYRVCDGSNETICCKTANVTLSFTDNIDPELNNVPADITISCDEEVPLPPLITTSDNCPAVAINKEEISTKGTDDCAQYDYTITRSWTATDLSNRSVTAQQIVTIQDHTSPDIFRIYTLPSGQKLIAGVTENVYQEWKTISFPIQFSEAPLVFSQVITNRDTTPIVARVRNISAKQFELKIQEEAANDNKHSRENISWIAISAGTQTTDYPLEVGNHDLSNALSTLTFEQPFDSLTAFFTSIQSINDKEVALSTIQSMAEDKVTLRLEEETSIDTDITHLVEQTAYLALSEIGNITNNKGAVIGEVGISSTDIRRIPLKNNYFNPVVIAQVISNNNETTPVAVRVENVRATSFDIGLQGWDYYNNNNPAIETIAYLVIEGSIPLDASLICEFGTDSLELGVDIIAIDNCDNNVSIEYEEGQAVTGVNKQTVRTWFAEDACGNHTSYSQVVSCEGVSLQMKAFLQGALVGAEDTTLMRDDLRTLDYIPLTEPYSDMQGFVHVGAGGGETISQELLDQTGDNAIVDWVFIELKDTNNYEQVLATCAGLLQRDGDVVNVNGDPIISFYNIPHGYYYVKLRHRNHLAVETLYPYNFTANRIPFINFSNPNTQVRGRIPNIKTGSLISLWSGDLNGDNNTIFQGPNNDVFYLFLQILLDAGNENNLSNFISEGYTNKDFNMDGRVIFQGPDNDRAILLWNTVFNHPDNDNKQSNFIVNTTEVVAQADYDDCVEDNTLNYCDFDGDGKLNGDDPDDDNDGVADGEDANPYDDTSDSDGDGISDQVETGGDGVYHLGTDSDPLSACDPDNTGIACDQIDQDQDGYFSNYDADDDRHDPNDFNPCEPDGESIECSCPDDDDDGYIYVCNRNENYEGGRTIRIKVEDWIARKAFGNECGPCQDTIVQLEGCAAGVALLNSTSTTAKGANSQGIPSIQAFEVPEGNNRVLVLMAAFEREHCVDPYYCSSSNSEGDGLGDNFALTNYITDKGPEIKARFSGISGSIDRKNQLDLSYGDFAMQFVYPSHLSASYSYFNRESYFITINESEIAALLGGDNSGMLDITLPGVRRPDSPADDAILLAFVFENVDQSPAGAVIAGSDVDNDFVNGISGNYSKTIANISNEFAPTRIEDGLLVLGVNGLENTGFVTMPTFREIEYISTTNSNESYTKFNEGDGLSASVQFRNGAVSNGSLILQSKGAAETVCNGGMALAFTLKACISDAPDATPAYIDSDNDGFSPSLSAQNTLFDPDDANPCNPEPDNTVCGPVRIDEDGDGYYANYPENYQQNGPHPLYDDNDSDTCAPLPDNCAECIDYDGDGKIVICKLATATGNSATQVVNLADWAGYRQAGDYCGPCAEFTTIADGNWDNAATWENGSIPPSTLDGQHVRINHTVQIEETLTLDNDSYLWIENANFTVASDQKDLLIKNGAVYILHSTLNISDDLKMFRSSSKLITEGSSLTVQKRFAINRGIAHLSNGVVNTGIDLDITLSDNALRVRYSVANLVIQNVDLTVYNNFNIENGSVDIQDACIIIKRHWLNEGTATIQNSCLEIEGDLWNVAGSSTTFDKTNINLNNSIEEDFGLFRNYGTLQGNIDAIWVQEGNVENSGDWSATVENACVSGNNAIPASFINNNNCSTIATLFDTCPCIDASSVDQSATLTVNLLNQTSKGVSGKGTSGIPSITGFNIPAGQNRQMVVLASFERNHCQSGDTCNEWNTSFNGLGDSYTNTNYPALEKDQTIDFNLSGTSTTITKTNKIGDAYGNFHSARNMVFFPESWIYWTQELNDYYKATYSTEYYFITLNESEISNLLSQAPDGDININFPNIQAPKNNADDAILMAFVFENVSQSNDGVTLSGKLNKGKAWYAANNSYTISNLIDGTEPDEPTDGLLVLANSPVEDGFQTMPGFTEIAEESVVNAATGSTDRGEPSGISTSVQFRNGLTDGIIDGVSIQANGYANPDPLGGVIFAFTLEGADQNNEGTMPPVDPDEDGDGYTASTDVDDNNACVPIVGPNCTGIDADVDGFFSNYAEDHTLYDSDDTNSCLPDPTNCPEICGNGIDDDNDGLIDCEDGDCDNINRLPDSEFNNNTTTDWEVINHQSATVAISIDNTSQLSGANALFVDMTGSSDKDWHTEIIHNNHRLYNTKTYRVSFEAKAVANRAVNIELQLRKVPYDVYWSETVNLTTTSQVFTFENITVDKNIHGDVGIVIKSALSDVDFWLDNITFEERLTYITPYVQINEGSWEGDKEVATVSVGDHLCLGWQPNLPPVGGTVKWINQTGTIVGTEHDFCINSISSTDAGTYIMQYTSASGCIKKDTFTVTTLIAEICNNGEDDDGDGLIDCEDDNCGKPAISIVEATVPNNCPTLDNGHINITATGNNLAYSIDDGATYHPTNDFFNLIEGTYFITVKNTVTGCITDYTQNPVDLIVVNSCNSDADADGYANDVPVSDPMYDPNDADPCSPQPGNPACIAIDADLDGYYENYPIDYQSGDPHPLYDDKDNDRCFPDATYCDECPKFYGHSFICYQPDANGLGQNLLLGFTQNSGDYLNNGDNTYCGPCITYRTIADGDWDSPNTWVNGHIPPTNLVAEAIRISHNVTIQQSLEIGEAGNLWVSNGSLTSQDITIIDGSLSFTSATLTMDGELNIHKTSTDKDAFFLSRSSTINITGNYQNHGGATYYEFSCVQVDGNYENDFGLEIVEETCLMVNNNYINRGNLRKFFDVFASKGLYIINAKFHIKGNLENHGMVDDITIGLHTYDGFKHLWVEGNVLNYDDWGADVENEYCIDGNNDIPSSKLKGDTSCNSIASKFEDCTCSN